MIERESKVYVAGHRGLAGSAITRRLKASGYENLILKTRGELDLKDQAATRAFFASERPEFVFMCAAKVGGIGANANFPADFIAENLVIQSNVVDAAFASGVKKLCFLGSSCIYPKFAKQPIPESELLTGPLESSNLPYAIAKIAGLTLCQSYTRQHGFNTINLMPTNLYGPNDNFDLSSSHVLPALIRRFIEAKDTKSPEVKLWGTGKPLREFLFCDDLADAALFLMKHHNDCAIVNVGTGEEISIHDLAHTIARIVGYTGDIRFDTNQLDGTPRKLLDVSKLKGLGWRAATKLEDGIRKTTDWYRSNQTALTGVST